MNTPITLAEALRRAGRTLADEQPPAALLARIQARLPPTAVQPATTPSRAAWARPWAWSGAAACAAVLMGSVLLMWQAPTQPHESMLLGHLTHPPRGADDVRRRPGGALTAPELSLSGFVPVVPQDRWPADDAPAWLVSTELNRDRLAALGLPFDPGRAGESVRAQLLVRATGEVLAVRLAQ